MRCIIDECSALSYTDSLVESRTEPTTRGDTGEGRSDRSWRGERGDSRADRATPGVV